ncbi:MAG: TIGR02117 family protein [Planctomycetota bacterium]
MTTSSPPRARRRRRWLRRLARGALGVVAAVALYVAGFWLIGLIPINTGRVPPAAGIDIWVIHRGVHVDFVVPLRSDVFDWTEEIDVADFDRPTPGATHLIVGWGSRGFYLETMHWSDLRPSTALRAVSYLGGSALHLELMLEPATTDNQRRLVLTRDEYHDLVRYIRAAFARGGDGRVQVIAGFHYADEANPGHDAFYEAVGRYGLFHTCNTWVNEGLRRIGVRAALWAVFGSSVIRHVPAPP